MHSKGNYKQGEKTTLKWEKIIANGITDKGLISKAAHTRQCQKNNQPNQKVGERTKQTFLQRKLMKQTNKHG